MDSGGHYGLALRRVPGGGSTTGRPVPRYAGAGCARVCHWTCRISPREGRSSCGSNPVKSCLEATRLGAEAVVPVTDVTVPPVLAIGECATTSVEARRFLNHSGIHVVRGGEYRFDASGKWYDASIECGPEGYVEKDLAFLRSIPLRVFSGLRRVPDARWFELIAEVGQASKRFVRIGNRLDEWIAPADGELCAFANDVTGFYWNNRGSVGLTVTRTR